MTCYESSRALAALKMYEDETRLRPFSDVSQSCTTALYDALREAVLALAANDSPENDQTHAVERASVTMIHGPAQTT